MGLRSAFADQPLPDLLELQWSGCIDEGCPKGSGGWLAWLFSLAASGRPPPRPRSRLGSRPGSANRLGVLDQPSRTSSSGGDGAGPRQGPGGPKLSQGRSVEGTQRASSRVGGPRKQRVYEDKRKAWHAR